MQKLVRVSLFVALLICFAKANKKVSCEAETSFGYHQSTFKWGPAYQEGTYNSQPLCLSEKGDLIKRKCLDGHWYPEQPPNCRKFLCPKNFISVNSSCVYITEPRTYENGCPNVTFTSLTDHATTEYRWTAIRRKIRFGPLEYDTPSKNYGKFLKQGGSFDCMVKNDSASLVNVNCSALYSHQCNYRELLRKQINKIAMMEIVLKFNSEDRKMFLIIYSPELILNVKEEDDEANGDDDDDDDDDGEAVYCFTDAKGNLKEKVDIERVYDSRKASLTTDHGRRKNFVVYELDLENDPGQYWCEVFSVESSRPTVSNVVIGYEGKKGNEYALRVNMKNLCNLINCTKAFAYFKELEKFCKIIRVRCRLMEIFNLESTQSELLVHVTSKQQRNVIGEYYTLKNRFEGFNTSFMSVVYFRSSDVCLPDTSILGENKLYWPLTPLGSMTTPKELCLNQDGLFLTRNCEGSFLYGAEWSDFNDTCSPDAYISTTTQFLYDAITQNLSVYTLQDFTNNSQELAVVDLSLISDGLYRIAMENASANSTYAFVKSVSNIMKANNVTLKRAQIFLNSTDKILDATESFLKKPGVLDPAVRDLRVIKRSNFLIHVTKPFRNNVTGLALYGSSTKSFLDYTIINLNSTNSFSDLDTVDLELAVYVPYDLLQTLSFNMTQSAKENIVVITTIYFNDSLFNQNETKMSAQGKIIGVTIPGFGTYLESPLPLLFRRSSQNSSKEDCAFWNYGQDSQTRKGRWSTLGENYLEALENDSYVSCAFSHLTHFALLILSERVTVMEEADGVTTTVSSYRQHEWDLMIITAVGCSFSFVGILGIFLTAALFKRWREKIGTKILLQLSVTIILEIIATQIAGLENWLYHNTLCTTIGVLLQYIVLSQFSWMLVIAYLQYLRFVKVLGVMPPRLLLKSMIVGWLVPLVPVVLTVSISPSSYSAGYQKFCYPKELALYIGLIAPAVITVVANILIFVVIMYSVSNSKAKLYSKSKQTHKLQILLLYYYGTTVFYVRPSLDFRDHGRNTFRDLGRSGLYLFILFDCDIAGICFVYFLRCARQRHEVTLGKLYKVINLIGGEDDLKI